MADVTELRDALERKTLECESAQGALRDALDDILDASLGAGRLWNTLAACCAEGVIDGEHELSCELLDLAQQLAHDLGVPNVEEPRP